ncbi:MAG: penicillin-binding protein [Helicobacteraceae bacterium 4484_230]|nr:MAG: penicillin-binding protein [Helicobacteraceae bacterium 4484_230]
MKKFFLFLLLVLLAFPIVYVLYFSARYGHETRSLVEFNVPRTTQIFDRNGKKIANIFLKEHRYYATFDEIPPRLIEALLAIEDTVFFEHSGINTDAIFRAIIKDIKAMRLVEGASTITQQLVKNTLLTREKKFSRKLKELIFALKIERELSKEEILERYLNVIYLGHGYYGVATAAEGYFHKDLQHLTLKEMAILVGLPKAPSFYAPTKNYELSLGRANRVIERMYVLGWIDDATRDEALAEMPIVHDDTLTKNRAPYITDEVLRRASKIYPDVRTGGYIIKTTIDLALQKAARDALAYAHKLAYSRAENAGDFNKTAMEQLNGALVSIDPKEGDILALVGGVDYAKSSYNRATQAKRQPGSAFKPFIYQVAIDHGYSGATKLVDIARTYNYEKEGEETKWRPKNYEEDYKGLITMREAMVHSRNLATINLVTDIGLRNMRKELKRYEIDNLPNDLSLALGSITMAPLELAKHYSTFAGGGVQVEPFLISSMVNHRSAYKHEKRSKVITTPQQAFLMTSILQDVVKRGTGRRARVRGIELAGKTGTTNKSIDAWFAGYSPTVETVVWFGNDNNTPMRRRETGGRVAGPAFSYYYRQLIKLYPHIERKFTKPDGVIEVNEGDHTEYFTKISKPPETDTEVDPDEVLIF